MAKRIIKKIGGDRIGSGGKMTVAAHGYGYSTNDVSKVRRTSMSFGTIVPMGQWLMPTGSRLRLKLDALITSNALQYQLYGSAKFQLDVYSARMALYNPKMLLNLNDQGYNISDIKFPLMKLKTKGIADDNNISNKQVNPSALLRYLGIAGNGQNENGAQLDVERKHMAMWLLMYYQTIKEYYSNKQEKIGMMIHNLSENADIGIISVEIYIQATNVYYGEFLAGEAGGALTELPGMEIRVRYKKLKEDATDLTSDQIKLWNETAERYDALTVLFNDLGTYDVGEYKELRAWNYSSDPDAVYNWYILQRAGSGIGAIHLKQFDLKAIDRMMMAIMSNVESTNPIEINSSTEFPFGASFKDYGGFKSINGSQEGLCVGTYQSDVFNNWLDNTTINNLTSKNKVKVDENGEFSIDMLNITQKLYNYDMRIGITDGTLEEWRELTYAQVSKGKSLKPVYEGGLSKEILFDMVVSTAATDEEPLGSIASRGQFGSKHKGGYAQIEADEEKLVMVLAKITPRIVYNQGNDWTTNLKTLEDLHKPALDKIGYQNLITDQMAAVETIVKADGTLTTYSAGKQPAWQWYRTNYDDALGNMADTEDYKVFGRTYEYYKPESGDKYRIKDLTTYIDPMKYNDVFAIDALDAMNFDVQVGMDATMTLVMSEEVIPSL